MIVKSAGFAMIALLSLVGIASAQTNAPASSESTTSVGGSAATVGAITTNRFVSNTALAANVGATAVGWLYLHPMNCLAAYDGVSTTWLYFYFREGGYAYTSSSSYQGLMNPACQTGNWIGIYIDNYPFTGHWSNLVTYQYK